jgi:hypothetical protein
MKRIIFLLLISFCTIGGEESKGVVTIESTTQVKAVEEETALIDASLEFSQCMREEGIDFPDPTPGEFGFFAFRDADVDWSSEQVQEAFEICQPENPLENLDD